MNASKKILVVCPTVWDIKELARIRHSRKYEFIYWPYRALGRPRVGKFCLALTHLRLLNPERFIADTVAHFRSRDLDGVISTDDYLGSVLAAAIAEKLGLLAPSARSILTCQHKYYSRLVQRASVPSATPDFSPIETADARGPICSLTYPFFVKPVRGTFSILAKKVENQRELVELVTLSATDNLLWHLRLRSFNRLLRRYTEFETDANYFLGEELLGGQHVSLEGYCYRGEMHVIGILDSYMYDGTNSFKRFEYPSRLPDTVQARMQEIARALTTAVNFDNGLFEIEMYYDPPFDTIRIIEVNPRACPQFADLFEKVDGTNSYELLLAIATGEEPRMCRGQGKYSAAASFVIRTFRSGRTKRLPDAREIARAKNLFPGIRVRLFYEQGDRLSARVRQLHDGASIRIAALNLGGADRTNLLGRFLSAVKELPFEVEPSDGFDRLLLEASE